jgi:hypothetical protein
MCPSRVQNGAAVLSDLAVPLRETKPVRNLHLRSARLSMAASARNLRAAQQRISELEVEVVAYQNQAERAEQWLHKVYTEIEDRFLQQGRSRARNATQ